MRLLTYEEVVLATRVSGGHGYLQRNTSGEVLWLLWILIDVDSPGEWAGSAPCVEYYGQLFEMFLI